MIVDWWHSTHRYCRPPFETIGRLSSTRTRRVPLTPLGEVAAEEVAEFQSTIETAWELAPVLEATAIHDIDIDLEAFAGATVTTAAPGNPYRPASRFMSLVETTETVRGLDPASINPLHIHEIYDRIVAGMETEAVYPSEVVEELLTIASSPVRSGTNSGSTTAEGRHSSPIFVIARGVLYCISNN